VRGGKKACGHSFQGKDNRQTPGRGIEEGVEDNRLGERKKRKKRGWKPHKSVTEKRGPVRKIQGGWGSYRGLLQN